jgi:hypothetical protein
LNGGKDWSADNCEHRYAGLEASLAVVCSPILRSFPKGAAGWRVALQDLPTPNQTPRDIIRARETPPDPDHTPATDLSPGIPLPSSPPWELSRLPPTLVFHRHKPIINAPLLHTKPWCRKFVECLVGVWWGLVESGWEWDDLGGLPPPCSAVWRGFRTQTASPDPTRPYPTRLYQTPPGRTLPDLTQTLPRSYQTLADHTRPYQTLTDPNRSQRTPRSPTRLHWIITDPTDTTRAHQTLRRSLNWPAYGHWTQKMVPSDISLDYTSL